MNQVSKLGLILALVMCGLGGTAAANEAADDSGMSYDAKLQACAACHGENGDKPLAPDYPILAGQYADYLQAALKAYRSGRREHPIMSMQVQALGLTDGDIAKLAQHFSSQKGLRGLGE